MSSSSRVLLPTPLRPTIDTVSPGATVRLKSSMISVGPQPPNNAQISSMAWRQPKARSPAFSEIDGLHIGRCHDLERRAGHHHLAVHHHCHLGCETPHDLHVVL